MKKIVSRCFHNFLLSGLLLFLSFGAHANHINGIDLGYTWVSGNTYKVTLIIYGNCASSTFGSLATAAPVICIFDSSSYNSSITLSVSGPGVKVSNVCPRDTDSTTCTNTSFAIAGTERFIYTGTVTLPSTAKCWRFVFTGQMGSVSAGRVATTNLAGSITIIYLQDTLNNLASTNVNSPDLTVIPTPYYCESNPDNYNPGAIDPDGDSLSFALTGALTNGGSGCSTASSAVGYNAGYSGTNPLQYAAGTFSFSNTTGQISYTPTLAGTFCVDYNIRKYRSGVVVGTSQREMYFLVQTCSVAPPTGAISGASTGTIVDSTHYSVCHGSGLFSFHINPTEPDTFNTITITTTGVPAWATLSIVGNGTNHPTCTFSGNSSTVAAGAYSFSLTYLDNNCPIAGSNTIAYYVTIATPPSAITFAKDSVCVGATITYSDATSGGTWSSASVSIATVGSSGAVTGVSTGITNITYTSGIGCYRDTLINVMPNPAAITGTFNVCVGNTTSLGETTAGGTWSSGATTIATVNPSGVVTGIGSGTANISYTVATGCYIIAVVTVNVTPAVITGAITSVCVGSTITYGDASAGGTWSSSNTAFATVDASGDITGVGTGVPTISYSFGTCYRTKPVTVNPLPSIITGFSSVCVGSTITLADSIAGGTWTSGTPSVATITSGGVVTGVTTGTSTITYTLSATGCYRTFLVTVVGVPSSITGTLTVCTGLTTTLSDVTIGGTWTSSNLAKATISSSGVVTGIAAGNSTIDYTIGSGCFVSAIVTVNNSPAPITGATTICLGSHTTLGDVTLAGTWSSTTTTVATITGGGVATGAGLGTSLISYTLADGCAATTTLTVNNAPGPITGTLTVCNGFSTSLSDGVAGGTWSSVTTSVATITGGGVVTGASPGTSLISYAIGTCAVTATVTVNIQPVAITGTFGICNFTSTTLSDLTAGGTWSSVTPGVATITGGGVVTGASVGTTLISYTIGTCVATVIETVSALPSAGSISAGSGVVCVASTLSLTDAAGGGVWSSVTPSAATVSATGVVTGVSNGTDSIKYTVTNGCGTVFAATIITVNPLSSAGSISGTSSLCVGTLVTLSDATGGGVWSSGTPSVATVSATGVVTGVSSGTDIISYGVTTSCGTGYATYPITVNVSPSPGAISGPSIICAGSFAIMSDGALGGTWSAANANATVSSSGTVTGVTGGVDTISYTITNTCGTASATKVVTLSPLPVGAPVTGPTSVCAGSTITLSDAVAGGTWHATNTHATVSGTGVVTGTTGGTDTIYYSLSNSCGTTNDSAFITLNPLPNPGTITGSVSVCVGSSITVSDPAPGGTYSISNTNATMDLITGIVTGVTGGIDTVSYTVTNVCGTAIANKFITIVPLPATGVISGPGSVCQGSAITLSNSISGGTWSGSNTTASISGTGVVTGLAPGIDTISYTLATACGSAVNTTVITINPLPSAGTVSSPTAICVGALATMTSTLSGGTWSISNAHATINSSTGVVFGVSTGIDTVTYSVTNVCGTATLTRSVTVNPYPFAGVISGAGTVCQGAHITLTESVTGGIWSSGSAITTITSSGVVTGVTAGTDSISYTVSNTCGTVGTYKLINVIPLPVPGSLSGPSNVCLGATITLADTASGGTWSSVYPSIAMVSGGVVTGVSIGVDTIKYALTNSCGTVYATATIPVVSFPDAGSISGPSSVCTGAAITLLDMVTGGTWMTSNGNASLLGPGIVSGVAAGTDTIFYAVTNSCGTAMANVVVTINATPSVAAISGPSSLCTGTLATMTNATAGGTWISSNPAVVTIDVSSGHLTALTSGIATITYSITSISGCPGTAIQTVTVNVGPVIPAITGTTHDCIFGTTTLSDGMAGGTWSSSNTSVATVTTAGVVTAFGAGTATITYSVIDICGTASVTTLYTANALPVVASIMGTLSSCAGVHNTLMDSTAGGTWSTNDSSVASINSSTGVITGITPGTVTVNYTVTNTTSCVTTVTAIYTVDPLPFILPITGTTNECVGGTQMLSDSTIGGTWSSSNTTVATVNTSGLVTGLSMGIVTISYTEAGSGCTGAATIHDTVNIAPVLSPITGTMNACIGSATTLFDAVPWGTWSSENASIATINPGTGVVIGVASGTVEVKYNVTNSCGSVIDSALITVNNSPAVAPVTGSTTTICAGATTVLNDATTGGTWSSGDTSIATIGSTSGLVTGIAAGNVTFTYSIINSLGCPGEATYTITFGSSIGSSYVTPSSATICHGHTVYMHVITSGSGLSYQWLLNGNIIPGATNYNYTADTIGHYSVIVSNGVCEETLTGTHVINITAPVIGFTSPDVLYTGSYAHYQWYLNGSPIPGATNSIYTESAPGVYQVVVTDANGCSITSASHVVTSGGGGSAVVNVTEKDIHIYPNPATSVIIVDAPVVINIKILSPDGKVVIEQKSAKQVDISALSDGLYIIMVYNAEGLIVRTDKFMKLN